MLPSRISVLASLVCYGIEIFSPFNRKVVSLLYLFCTSCSSSVAHCCYTNNRQRNGEAKIKKQVERKHTEHLKHQPLNAKPRVLAPVQRTGRSPA